MGFIALPFNLAGPLLVYLLVGFSAGLNPPSLPEAIEAPTQAESHDMLPPEEKADAKGEMPHVHSSEPQ